MKGDTCCSEGRVYACCPDEPTTPAPILEHCPMIGHEEMKKVCPFVTAVFPGTAGKCWMKSGETHKFICSCPSLLGGYGEQRGVCVKDCKTIKQDMVCDCGWGNCEEPRRIFDTSLYLWVCGCCASRPLILQIFIDKVVCVETKEVAPTNETMATTVRFFNEIFCKNWTDPDQSYTEWGCKQTKMECGVKERLATWMGRDLVNANGASFEDMECSDCQKGPEGISMSNEKMTPWETPMPKPGKLFAPASSIKVRCTNKHRCFPTFLERGELTGQQQMTFKLKGQYVVRRTQDEAVQLHCDQTVPLLCKAADGFLNEFIFDEFYKQTKNGAFLDEYTKVRASC
uniref:VWFD domain-containing protein n=1 Tax=Globodera pallida TaxID=36090 RepID=A0A183CAE6_GLOPA